MQDWAWLGSAVGALGIIGTIVGVLIGKRSERRAAFEDWQRDHRLAAYLEMVEAAHTFGTAAMALIRGPSNSDSRAAAYEVMLARRAALDRAQTSVRLLGPATVAAQAKAVVEAAKPLIESISSDDNVTALRVYLGDDFDAHWPEGMTFDAASDRLVDEGRDALAQIRPTT